MTAFMKHPGDALQLAVEAATPIAMVGAVGIVVAGMVPIWIAAISVGPLILLVTVHLFISMRRDDENFPRASSALGAFAFGGSAVGWSLASYLAIRGIALSWPLALQSVVFIFFGVWVFVVSLMLSRPGPRAWVLRLWKGFGPIGPALNLAVLFVWTTSLFAAVTFVFERHNLVDISQAGGGRLASFEKIADLYSWQFAKAIPLLDVNKTLRWSPPLLYHGSATGVLILLYKIAVIVPVIGTFVLYWRSEPNGSPSRGSAPTGAQSTDA
jgi:hypothetical protein